MARSFIFWCVFAFALYIVSLFFGDHSFDLVAGSIDYAINGESERLNYSIQRLAELSIFRILFYCLSLVVVVVALVMAPVRAFQLTIGTIRKNVQGPTPEALSPAPVDELILHSFVVRSLLLPVAVLLGCWAAVVNAWDRWFEPWGSISGGVIFAFAIGLWLILLAQSSERFTPVRDAARWAWISVAALLSVYGLAFVHVPSLVSCEIAAAALGIALIAALPSHTRSRSWGLVVLIMLSMHVSTSLDFFVGFPLRVISARLADLMLGPVAFSIGTGLTDGSMVFNVDGPCSGVHMLSTGLALASAVSLVMQFRFLKTFLFLCFAVLLVIFGNAQRAATLFLMGAELDSAAHTAFGIIVFAQCALVLIAVAVWLKRREQSECADSTTASKSVGSRSIGIVAFATILAATGPLLGSGTANGTDALVDSLKWPDTWSGRTLLPVALNPDLEAYIKDFPGAWAQFRIQDSDELVLLRICTVATRALHSAENCFKAQGGNCDTEDSLVDEHGHVWSRFRYYDPDGGVYYVRQCYFAITVSRSPSDLDVWISGVDSWPDVSSWYWAAALPGSNVERTLAITVVSDTPW
ncbi:MAG: hypothetical protein AMXMBFR84_13080 [Candidatus Hydrogenedentota bacterium]